MAIKAAAIGLAIGFGLFIWKEDPTSIPLCMLIGVTAGALYEKFIK